MIEDLKELTCFLKICRKYGVTNIQYRGVDVKFGDLPSASKSSSEKDSDEIPTDELSPEQLMYYGVVASP